MKIDPGAILLVDSRGDVSDVVQQWLQQQDHAVTTAEAVDQAFDLMQLHAFDLILLNIILQADNRYFRLLEQIKADELLRPIPVMIIAEVNEVGSVARCVELGAEDYLLKPFTEKLLQARVEANLDRKRLRDQRQLYEETIRAAKTEKSKFISYVAHELRTPLTSIKGYASLLRSGTVGPINDNQTNFLNTIIANAERMATLLTNLNDVSRIEAHRLRVDFAAVDVREVIDKVVRSFQDRIAAREQALTLQIPQNLPSVWADPDRLNQILTSLLNNAHKYTPEGGQISLTVRQTSDRNGVGEMIIVSIEDDGPGIRQEDQAQIFEKFFRSEDEAVQNVSGAGLGLHLAKRLVEIQQGQIWFESTHGRGSTFYFTVPVAKISE